MSSHHKSSLNDDGPKEASKGDTPASDFLTVAAAEDFWALVGSRRGLVGFD
jgi:hypothetical protein